MNKPSNHGKAVTHKVTTGQQSTEREPLGELNLTSEGWPGEKEGERNCRQAAEGSGTQRIPGEW